MLPGMLLHKQKAPRPVDLSFHACSHRKRMVRGVQQIAILFLDIQHLGIAKRAVVRRLSAAFRIKRGPVERDNIAIFLRFTAGDNRCKLL